MCVFNVKPFKIVPAVKNCYDRSFSLLNIEQNLSTIYVRLIVSEILMIRGVLSLHYAYIYVYI